MSGMDQTNDWPGGGSEYYTTEASSDSHRTTANEYATTTDQWGYVVTQYPGESTTTTTTTTATSQSTATSTATAVSSKSNTNTSSTNTTNTKTIAIAVPVAVVGAVIIASLLFFICRRRRQRNRNHNHPIPAPQANMTPVPRDLHPPPNRSSTWEFAPTNSHDIPFSGPIPGRPVPQHDHPRDLNPSSSIHTGPITTPIPTENRHLTPNHPPPASVAPAQSHPIIPPTIPTWSEQPRDRPTSPFDHPLDDAVSEISRRSRDLDDISSVSSFGEDEERRPAMLHRS
ncbi:uncharacterized protein BO80DRAFT_137987 [Aspergillus ibericus CBS 121593]|uniref:Uncharacterized protein n=1 Tax=Aspergillus ibericus CBS 121593 TaxID=1448316 RepID=A0A395HEF8_9EURO|nr:hypothetical protein BO80DRAFT_137987 [Aspergillus ibericus CBS 121593]RAL05495.1 hypothetical protein BO80DRAFT_137987 [Aspergillus ibericus CBS 121593]